MNFKVGDYVTIRKDLKSGHGYDIYCAVGMTTYAGKTFRITKELKTSTGLPCFYLNLDDCEDDRWKWTKDMLEPAHLDKAPLEIGHIIECRNGNRYYVHCKDRAFRYEGSLGLINAETLVGSYEIVKEYRINEEKGPFTLHNFETTKGSVLELVWEKKEIKEMTVAEIEKVLGYGVKIVKESEEDEYEF